MTIEQLKAIAAAVKAVVGDRVYARVCLGANDRELFESLRAVDGAKAHTNVYQSDEPPLGRFSGPFAIDVAEIALDDVTISAQASRPATAEEIATLAAKTTTEAA